MPKGIYKHKRIYTDEERKIRKRNGTARWRKNNSEKYKISHKKSNLKWEKNNPKKVKEIGRKSATRYRKKYPEKAKASVKKYRKNNVEKIKECVKKYQEKNKEKLREYNKKWKQDNAEYVNEYVKKYCWRKKNPERALENKRRWQRENKDKLREERIRRRARKLGVEGGHTFGEWETLKAQYNWTCPCCRKSEPEIKLTEDHIIPLSKGGSDNIENIQPLCQSCNSRKHTKTIKYFIKLVTPE